MNVAVDLSGYPTDAPGWVDWGHPMLPGLLIIGHWERRAPDGYFAVVADCQRLSGGGVPYSAMELISLPRQIALE